MMKYTSSKALVLRFRIINDITILENRVISKSVYRKKFHSVKLPSTELISLNFFYFEIYFEKDSTCTIVHSTILHKLLTITGIVHKSLQFL